MKRINAITKGIVIKRFFFSLLLLASVAIPSQALADCNGAPANYRRSIVTYYETPDVFFSPTAITDSRCTLTVNATGRTVCRTRLRGVLYRPLDGDRTAKFPAIIVNHGSGADFEANTQFCEIANYFCPRGYMVLVPFRRGQGDEDAPYPDDPPNPNDPTDISDKSTGIYIDDFVADFVSANPTYIHQTNCAAGDGGCYRAELFKQQAEQEVADYAMNYLKNRPDIKVEGRGDYAIAIMGNSYGGAVTVLANRIAAGHKAAVAFSPAAQQWAVDNCLPEDQTCGGAVQRALLSAAKNATKPAFYLQAKWDYDTRPTIDLAYAHAYGSSDDKHGNRFMASIFPYPNPCPDTRCTDDNFQSAHVGFFRDTDRWGPFVLEFLRQYGVK